MAAAATLGAHVNRMVLTLGAIVLAWTAWTASAATHVLIFTGHPGEDAYAVTFADQAQGFDQALRDTGAQITRLTDAQSSRDALRRQLDDMRSLRESDQLVLIYIGHGSYDGRHYKVNLHGPDVSAGELGSWLDPIPARQLIILASSASGAALDVLANPRRTLMTATRSGDQSNVTVFGRYLLAALDDASADLDKNLQLSVPEAFQLASRSVEEHYQRRRLIPTEHPQLTNVQPGFMLSRVSVAAPDAVPVALASRRAETEAAIEGLKARKNDMTPDEYFQQLQQLLLNLAVIEQEIEQHSGIGAEGS